MSKGAKKCDKATFLQKNMISKKIKTKNLIQQALQSELEKDESLRHEENDKVSKCDSLSSLEYT